MAHLLARLDPTPGFPEYTGPYKVGTCDVEIPTAPLPSPGPAPDPSIDTLHFRIFYPCQAPDRPERPVRWIPQPQRAVLAAYARFLGARPAVAEAFSYLPNLYYRITIPVRRNAPLREAPTPSKRWPVMVFSHGLGGTRNSYSHLCGSLASHGLVVVAPDHRDGSSPISFIREVPAARPDTTEVNEKAGHGGKTKKRTVDYRFLSHERTKEVEDGRNDQLRIRLWELSLLFEALLKLDAGEEMNNLDRYQGSSPQSDSSTILAMFRHALEVHRPGSVSWAGHSFGAATVVQFLKSIFYPPSPASPAEPGRSAYAPLLTVPAFSRLAKQIVPATPAILLDLWVLPLAADSTAWLWNKPMPSYARGGPGGANVLAILSEGFFKWTSNLQPTKRLLSPDPALADPPSPGAQPGPRIFYPVGSAHLSQSDFGVLFPWLTKKLCQAEDPERTLRLNARAILQLLREFGTPVAATSGIDQEAPEIAEASVADVEARHDWKILAAGGHVQGWVVVRVDDDDLDDGAGGTRLGGAAAPSDAVLQGEVLNFHHHHEPTSVPPSRGDDETAGRGGTL